MESLGKQTSLISKQRYRKCHHSSAPNQKPTEAGLVTFSSLLGQKSSVPFVQWGVQSW